jgi:NAD(P)-dependent dehydrogenase (short-subunit alcohol dehydrogenase family)
VSLQDRVVIVTGAGGGIGRQHALLLASNGARVVVNDLGGNVHGEGGSASMADQVVSEIEAAGGQAVASYDSVATAEGGEAMTRIALETFGRVDAVVHNAGILRDRSFAKMSADELDAVIDVHLRGGFFVTQPAFRVMKEQGHGRIVLTSSASGLLGNYGQANYGAAKMGLVGLMNVLAIEGNKHGILANVVAPTARTRMTEDLLGDLAERLDPAHVSPMVAYLCSDACDFTHEIFSVGGGRVARMFVGTSPGWYGGREPVDVDDIAANIDAIRSTEGFVIPEDGAAEVRLLIDALKSDR